MDISMEEEWKYLLMEILTKAFMRMVNLKGMVFTNGTMVLSIKGNLKMVSVMAMDIGVMGRNNMKGNM